MELDGVVKKSYVQSRQSGVSIRRKNAEETEDSHCRNLNFFIDSLLCLSQLPRVSQIFSVHRSQFQS